MKTITKQALIKKAMKKHSEMIAQKEVITLLEKLLTLISHNVRQPVAHILGLSYLIKNSPDSPAELHKKVVYMRQSALLLDKRTRELTALIYQRLVILK